MLWREGRALCEAKGYKLETIEDKLKEAFPGRLGFSAPTLSRNSKTDLEMPPEVEAVLLGMEILRGFEESYEIHVRGVEALKGRTLPFPPLAQAAPDPAALTLDKVTALEAKVDAGMAQLSAMAGKLDAVTGQLGAVDRKADDTHARLDATNDKLDAASVKHDTTHTKIDALHSQQTASAEQQAQHERKLMRTIWQCGAMVVAATAGIVTVSHYVQAATLIRAQPPAPATANVNPGQSSESSASDWSQPYFDLDELLRRLGLAANMGDGKANKASRPVPSHPMPGQALEPCPSPLTALHGGCWLLTGYTPPCPAPLYEEGGKCWTPIKAASRDPVGNNRPPGAAPHETPGAVPRKPSSP